VTEASTTFIIPAYNASRSLDRTMVSVVAQSRGDWEAIIVDDGSTDDTLAIARRWAAKDRRISVLTRENGGASAARNSALDAVRTRWVVFLDADDWIDARHLATLVPMVECRGEDHLAYCGYVRTTADGEEMPLDWCPDLQDHAFELLALRCEPAIHCVVVSAAKVREVGGFDPDLATCEDWDLWQRLARAGVQFHGTPTPLAFYQMRDGSLSTRYEHVDRDATIVLARGAGIDPRVPNPDPRYAQGSLEAARQHALAEELTAAGRAISGGGTPGSATLAPHHVALVLENPDMFLRAFFEGFLEGGCVAKGNAAMASEAAVAAFVALVQDVTAEPLRAEMHAKVRQSVTTVALSWDSLQRPRRLLDIEAFEHPIEQPFPTFDPQPGTTSLYVRLTSQGKAFGAMWLPLFGKVEPRGLARAAAQSVSLKALLRNPRLRLRPGFATGVAKQAGRVAVDTLGGRLVRRSGLQRTPKGLARELLSNSIASALGGADGRDTSSEAAARRLAQAAFEAGARSATPIAAEPVKDPEELDISQGREEYWEHIFAQPDPWTYDSPYEAEKYERTLSLVALEPVESALELACAEGHFTRRLATKVGRLLSTDISTNALERARKRCADQPNLSFEQLDFFGKPIPGGHDLVLCSEVLYFAGSDRQLADIAQKIAGAIRPGGRLVGAHANVLNEDPASTGFDWGDQYGVKRINAAFEATGRLALERQIVTELYRVSVFRRVEPGAPRPEPRIEHLPMTDDLDVEFRRFVVFGGAAALRSAVAHEKRFRVPVLGYAEIAASGGGEGTITEKAFTAHLGFLRRHGYSAMLPSEMMALRHSRRPAHGRPVMIVVDGGDAGNFEQFALPELRAHDLSAAYFVPVEAFGRAAGPDFERFARLYAQGTEIGISFNSLPPGTSPGAALYAAAEARGQLSSALGHEILVAGLSSWSFEPWLPEVLRLAGFGTIIGPDAGFADIETHELMWRRIEIAPEDGPGMLSEKLRYDGESRR
jgi:SAM-dependent methyltransferase